MTQSKTNSGNNLVYDRSEEQLAHIRLTAERLGGETPNTQAPPVSHIDKQFNTQGNPTRQPGFDIGLGGKVYDTSLSFCDDESDFAAIRTPMADLGTFMGSENCDFEAFIMKFEDEINCITPVKTKMAKYLFRSLGLQAKTYVKSNDPAKIIRQDYDALRNLLCKSTEGMQNQWRE